MSIADPILDNWYKDAETGRSFRVVDVDTDNDSIEVQFFNGDLGEYDTSTWFDSAFYPIEPPEDWSAPYGSIELDDLGYSDIGIQAKNLEDISLDDILDEEERD